MTPERSPLQAWTAPGWAAVALADFPAFLQDHAACERKAAAACLSLVGKYSEHPFLVEPLVSLAREELEHFQQVFRLLTKRGIKLALTDKDPYVKALLAKARHGDDEHLVDRLVISALIEARSCERFELVAAEIKDPELADFYATLARAEAGHHRVFLRIAERFFAPAVVAAALNRLGAAEAEIMRAVVWRPAVH